MLIYINFSFDLDNVHLFCIVPNQFNGCFNNLYLHCQVCMFAFLINKLFRPIFSVKYNLLDSNCEL